MSNSNSNSPNYKNALSLERPKTFIRGAAVLSSGIGYAFKRKGLLALALIPVFVSMVALYFGFGEVFSLYFSYASGALINEASFGFWGGSVVLWFSKAVLKILTGFLTFLTFYALLQVIYIPICSLLAERVLADKGIVRHGSILGSIAFNIRMVRTGLLKTLVVLLAGVLCFIGSFIPILNFVPIAFALIVLAYDCFDYGLELYGFSFAERTLFIRKELAVISGHAAVLFFFSFIPGLILITLPFSVIGASLLIGESDAFKRTVTP